MPQPLIGYVKLQKSDDATCNPSPIWIDIALSNFAYGPLLNWVFANNLTGSFGEIGFLQMRAVAVTTSGVAQLTMRLATKGVSA
jgi:hypothetical protein